MLPVLLRGLCHPSEDDRARRIDEDVPAAEGRLDELGRLRHVRGVRDVADARLGGAAWPLLADDVRGDVERDDPRTALGESLRDAAPDPGRGARDNGHHPLQIGHVDTVAHGRPNQRVQRLERTAGAQHERVGAGRADDLQADRQPAHEAARHRRGGEPHEVAEVRERDEGPALDRIVDARGDDAGRRREKKIGRLEETVELTNGPKASLEGARVVRSGHRASALERVPAVVGEQSDRLVVGEDLLPDGRIAVGAHHRVEVVLPARRIESKRLAFDHLSLGRSAIVLRSRRARSRQDRQPPRRCR